MSYILDALKRADAERERGAVPGLHAQPLAGTTGDLAAARQRSRGWPVGVTAVALLALSLVVAGVALWRGQGGSQPTPVVVAAVPVTTPAPPSSAEVPEPGLAVKPAVPPAVPTVNLPPMAARNEPSAPPPQRALAAAVQAPPSAATKAAPETATAKSARPAPRASAARDAPAMAPPISELPDEVRRLIPALAITGAVYSENPAQRLLLVNGQVLPQGATAAPQVVIEEIRSRSATFGMNGTRFRVNY